MGLRWKPTNAHTHIYSNILILRRLLLLPPYASQNAYPRLLRSNMQLMCASNRNVAPHWVCFKVLRPKQQSFRYLNLAAVFHVSKPCAAVFHVSENLAQQSFTYPNSTAVFHVSKPCSSLSCIQTLQQSFTYPNLAAVFQVSKPCQQAAAA